MFTNTCKNDPVAGTWKVIYDSQFPEMRITHKQEQQQQRVQLQDYKWQMNKQEQQHN